MASGTSYVGRGNEMGRPQQGISGKRGNGKTLGSEVNGMNDFRGGGTTIMENRSAAGRILITGGSGFIGSNMASRYLSKGWEVVVYDNFSRPGSEKNRHWLEGHRTDRLQILRGDVRDLEALKRAAQGVDVVAHLAAQVAVTTSVRDPMEDFSVNAQGGINVLEAARTGGSDPIVLYASTNKVYGALDKYRVTDAGLRHELPAFPDGIPEDFPIDLHSPYGCSKGSADLYMLDYARIYGLRTVVFRQSCIYGCRQFGVEDQGWVAHFVIASLFGGPITIYGDGRQLRDVLFIDDLLDAYEKAIERIDVCQGQAYNIGGGPGNVTSLLELIYRLEARQDRAITLSFRDWRPGDQKVYVSGIGKAERDLEWRPKTSVADGVEALCQWVEANQTLFADGGRMSNERRIEEPSLPIAAVEDLSSVLRGERE
jgi:CDP-paratose 2-epimerase